MKEPHYELYYDANDSYALDAPTLEELKDKYVEVSVEKRRFIEAELILMVDEDGGDKEYQDVEGVVEECHERYLEELEQQETDRINEEYLKSELRGQL